MSELSPAAKAIVAAAVQQDHPSAADQARVRDALRAKLAPLGPPVVSHVPPPNTAAALALGGAGRWFLGALLAGSVLASVARGRTHATPAVAVRAAARVAPRESAPASASVWVPARVRIAAKVPGAGTAHVVATHRAPVARSARVPAARSQQVRSPVRAVSTVAPVPATPQSTASAARPAPSAPSGPSDAMNNAVALYDRARYAEAAVEFQRVVEGATSDPPSEQARAQFYLARSLVRLEFYQSALSVLDEIVTRGAEHPYFDAALPWLAQLATRLPEPAGVARLVGRYEPARLATLDTTDTADLYDQLMYLLGRARYDEGRLDESVALFRRVRPRSAYVVRARFFEATAHVRSHHAQPAVAALQAAQHALAGGVPTLDDRARMTDLAWLELARVYYSTQHYAAALEAWSRVPTASEYWLDAQFEAAWAHFVTQDYARALGNVFTLNTPYFADAYYPESLLLRSVSFFANCQWDDADAAVTEFGRRYGALHGELERYLAWYPDNAALFRLLQGLRARTTTPPPAVRAVVSAALSDRSLARHLDYAALLAAEERRVAQLPPTARDGALGARIRQDLAVATSFAIDAAGDLARARYQRILDELRDLQNQATAIQIEVLSARRGDLAVDPRAQAPGRAHAPIVAVDSLEEGFEWPVTDEIWRDELGTYQQRVSSRCGR